MKTSGNRGAAYLALLVLAGLCVFVLIERERDPRNNAPPAADANEKPAAPPEADHSGKVAPTASPAIVTAPTGVADATIPELFAGLLKAAEEGDAYAAAQLRAALDARDPDEVYEVAAALLIREREAPHANSAKHRNRLTNIMYFVALRDPDGVFGFLRSRWSAPLRTEADLASWRKLQLHPLERRAADLLDIESQIEVEAIGNLVFSCLLHKPERAKTLLSCLATMHANGVVAEELPDPWLSGILARLAAGWSTMTQSAQHSVRAWLEAIVSQSGYSERLRAQAAALLLDDPRSFWEFLDGVSAAASLEGVARLLSRFLDARAMTDEEVELFLALYWERYGGDITGYLRLMQHAFKNPADPQIVGHWKEFSSSLMRICNEADSPEMFSASLQFLLSVRFVWGHKSAAAMARGAMLEALGAEGLSHVRKLHGRASDPAWDAYKVRGGFGGNMIALAFATDDDIAKRLSTVAALLEQTEVTTGVEFTYVVNGLDRYIDQLGPDHVPQVVALLETLFSRMKDFKKIESYEATRPISGGNPLVIHMRQMGSVLHHLGMPPLGEVSQRKFREWLVLVAEGAESAPESGDASTNWKQLRKILPDLLNKYNS